MSDLYDKFLAALHIALPIAPNHYLSQLSDSVKQVDAAASSDPLLSQYAIKLSRLIEPPEKALHASTTNEFAQLLGEAQFYLLSKNKGVALERVPESKGKTPDFKLTTADICFEVKTLSVVDGEPGIRNLQNASLNAQVEIEDQFNRGARSASSITVVQPYGSKPYQDGKGTITAVIDTLIEKTKNNFKAGQFSKGTTFVVLNLCILPPNRFENCILRPAYYDDHMFPRTVSGELWMLAFGLENMLILGYPSRRQDMTCVESLMTKEGFLVDHNSSDIAGMLFMIHPWDKEPEIWGLYTHDKYTAWRDNESTIYSTLHKLTENNWNDDKDSNGWQLYHPPVRERSK